MAAVAQLPGGLPQDGQLHRMAVFRPLTGAVERAIGDSWRFDHVLMRRVSAVLAAAVETIGGVAVTPEVAGRLAVGDRVYLMLQLAICYLGDRVWLSPICERCASCFDVPVSRSALPVRAPDENFPLAKLRCDGLEVEVRAPCGEDQCFLVESGSGQADLALLARCVRRVDGAELSAAFYQNLTLAQRSAIETAIERCSPEVDCSISVKCPECQAVQKIELEPYWLGDLTESALESEVHALALNYHWSESEILGLPRDLRRRYCALIDRERGIRG